nr:transposase [Gammaproteobacteria bacterium]
MIIKKAYKYRLHPTKEQEATLVSYAGHVRFLWNKALSINLNKLKNKQPIMYYGEFDYWSKIWKKSEEYGFLNECPAHIIQQKLKDLQKAFLDCFDKTQPNKKLPRFKKRGIGDSFRFPEPKHVKLEHNYITLPKLGRIKYHNSIKVVGTIKNYTVSRSGNHWYISIQVEQELQQEPRLIKNAKHVTKDIGLDVGVANFVTTSDGKQIAPINMFRALSKKLAQAQRKLKNRKKFSNNWKKQINKIRRIHQKIADTRRDFLNKLSTNICKSHAMIVVEDLKIKNMSKSAKGTLEQPGKNVKAKSGLNKSILDQGWFEFKRQLRYKSDWFGGLLLEVSAKHTSQKCSKCSYSDSNNRKT